MNDIPPNPPAPLHELTLALKQVLQQRVEKNLSSILATLSGTVFQRESPALDSFRKALGPTGVSPTLGWSVAGDPRVQAFYSCVPLTAYDTYSPYASRLFQEGGCRVSDIENLFAPGLPVFACYTSGTSGGAPKYFFKYQHAAYQAKPWDKPGANDITLSNFDDMIVSKVVDVIDDNGNVVKSLPVGSVVGCRTRNTLCIGPKDDEKLLSQKAKFWVSPFATYLIHSYYSSIFMNSLFALADPSVTVITAIFSSTIQEAVRIIEENWHTMVHAIENGCLPEAEGLDLGKYRAHLQEFVTPNPLRAADLRKVEVGVEGWLKKVWPSLTSVRATFSGQYAQTHPKLQHHFGPEISLQSSWYASTECRIGVAYGGNDNNLYQLTSYDHIELLDIEQERSAENISKPWELETGKKYEVIITSTDGLWRYMLNDIVEVAGFNPTDGQPLIRYCERKGVRFRIGDEFMTDSILQDVVSSLSVVLGGVLEFITELDDRKVIGAYGFFIELEGEIGPNAHLALAKVKELMCLHQGYKMSVDREWIEDPTIRIVAPGTFKAYREWKIQSTGVSFVQIKVPTTTIDADTRAWFVKRVVKEIGVPDENI